ncbi:MAG: hydrogen gas-evolving membrane-bound hydrogenase subunit E [Euryarchaeota archaeon]|nr:hydrogen gas-evolving membrane-bound hydrogenase subunit E [Euryarchaeota archaeon]
MKKIIAFAALLIVSGFLLITAVDMHDFGSPAEDDMDNYMIENAQEESAANNVVTSVVFDYRGFDTLGEATVLFTAVVGVSLLFRRKIK